MGHVRPLFVIYIAAHAEEFNQIINQNPLVIVDWKADWCGPCKQMKPHLQGLATKYKDTPVIAVDVDENGGASSVFMIL